MKIKYSIIAGLLTFASITHADLAVSNLGETIAGAQSIFENSAVEPYLGNRFTTGSSGDYAIDFVTMSFGTHNDTGDNFELVLYSDSGSAPGSLLATFTGPTNPTASSQVQYTLASSFNINANTTYWLIASTTSGTLSDYGWNYTSSSSETSSLGWTIANDSSTINSDFSLGTTTAGSAQIFNIDVVAIPEPATFGLIGAFGAALIFINRKYIM